MTRLFVTLAFLFVFALPVVAQTSVPAGKPLTIVFTHDGLNTTTYNGAMDKTAIPSVPVSVRTAAGTVQMMAPAVPAGTHTLELWATGVGGDSPRTSIALVAVPSAPNSISCASAVVTVGSGGSVVVTCQ
jgi:hypothetical protein